VTTKSLDALPPEREVDHKIEGICESQAPSMASYQLNQRELKELKKKFNKL